MRYPAEVCELDLKNGERSRRRVRDLVTQLAFEGRSENEIERARISMMARSDLLHTRAGYRCARPTIAILKIQLATHGRSIQFGSRASPPAIDGRASTSAMPRSRPRSCSGTICNERPEAELPNRDGRQSTGRPQPDVERVRINQRACVNVFVL